MPLSTLPSDFGLRVSDLNPPTFPARPINGGPFPKARPKPGDWFYEPKYNGWRALVHIPTGTMFNRQLQPLTIAAEFAEALNALRCTLDAEAFKWADCEALERRHNVGQGTLILLDVIPEPAFAQATWLERRAWIPNSVLWECHPSNKPGNGSLYKSPRIAPLYAADVWLHLQEINQRWGCDFYEGLVAKRADAPYPIQLHSPDQETTAWIKHRWQY